MNILLVDLFSTCVIFAVVIIANRNSYNKI